MSQKDLAVVREWLGGDADETPHNVFVMVADLLAELDRLRAQVAAVEALAERVDDDYEEGLSIAYDIREALGVNRDH